MTYEKSEVEKLRELANHLIKYTEYSDDRASMNRDLARAKELNKQADELEIIQKKEALLCNDKLEIEPPNA